MATMATSDAQKRATKNYSQTEKGKEARREAVKRYLSTEEGSEKLEAAKKRYESKEETKIKKAKWAKERYHRLKAEKLNTEKANE